MGRLVLAAARGSLSAADNALVCRFVEHFSVDFEAAPEQSLRVFDILVLGDTTRRSPKVLLALLYGAPIVGASWLRECFDRGVLALDSLWVHAEQGRRWGALNVRYAQQRGELKPLRGETVAVTASNTTVPHKCLRLLAELAGARVVDVPVAGAKAVMSKRDPVSVPDGVVRVAEHWVYDAVSGGAAVRVDQYRLPPVGGCGAAPRSRAPSPPARRPAPPDPPRRECPDMSPTFSQCSSSDGGRCASPQAPAPRDPTTSRASSPAAIGPAYPTEVPPPRDLSEPTFSRSTSPAADGDTLNPTELQPRHQPERSASPDSTRADSSALQPPEGANRHRRPLRELDSVGGNGRSDGQKAAARRSASPDPFSFTQQMPEPPAADWRQPRRRPAGPRRVGRSAPLSKRPAAALPRVSPLVAPSRRAPAPAAIDSDDEVFTVPVRSVAAQAADDDGDDDDAVTRKRRRAPQPLDAITDSESSEPAARRRRTARAAPLVDQSIVQHRGKKRKAARGDSPPPAAAEQPMSQPETMLQRSTREKRTRNQAMLRSLGLGAPIAAAAVSAT